MIINYTYSLKYIELFVQLSLLLLHVYWLPTLTSCDPEHTQLTTHDCLRSLTRTPDVVAGVSENATFTSSVIVNCTCQVLEDCVDVWLVWLQLQLNVSWLRWWRVLFVYVKPQSAGRRHCMTELHAVVHARQRKLTWIASDQYHIARLAAWISINNYSIL